jgi:hypothetical protein
VELALLLAAALGGLGLTFALPLPLPALPRLAAGFCAGNALLGLLALILAGSFGLGPGTLLASALLSLSPVLVLAHGAARRRAGEALSEARQGWRALRARPAAAVLLLGYSLALGGLLWRVFDRGAFVDERGLQTSDGHNMGDLPFHLAVIAGFTRGENFPPEHPELAGARLTYPFLADLVAALMVRAGATPARAIARHDFALSLALAVLLHHFSRRLTGDRWAALLAPLLVFLSGGLGFLLLFRDAEASGTSWWALMARPAADYTMRTEAGLRWGNALTTLLLTQRSFLMGLPMFVLAASLWWEATGGGALEDARRARAALAAAGVLVGLLPLVHGHSFAAGMAIACALALLFPRRRWLAFFVPALALAVPQALWLASGSALKAGSFLAFQVGWDRGTRDPVTFWLWNTGVFLPLLMGALAWRSGGRLVPAPLARFYLPFAMCFVAPNLLRLSPWIWDNIKFLFLWWVASAPLVAALLARWLRAGALPRAAGALLLLAAVLAGALDVWRVALPVRSYVLFDPDALAVADQITQVTPPRAVILHAPAYDSPVPLSGRRSVLGYEGHIWSQGLDQGRRAEFLKHVYEGGGGAEAWLRELGAGYVFVGPQERRAYRLDETFLGTLPLVIDHPTYELRRLP